MAATLCDRMRAFAADTLDYRPTPFPPTGKVIHDAVWGSIHLEKHEVVLLDCSLLQRLRYLHQTGFAFLTFPSARHTRFEHSLGVLRQTDNHLRALQVRFPDFVTQEATRTLRLAALLHDCSHGMFSHTSEEIYQFLPDMLEYTGPAAKYEGHKPSELIARFILESGPFQSIIDFFGSQKIPIYTNGHELARLITGDQKAFDPHKRWMIDIINGPLDADKLDYIARDGLHTGIPLSVDLDRFWLATEIQFLKKGSFEGIDQDQMRLVINRSGINAIEGILFARFQLTNSVYHHHKIRGCDCLFKSWIEAKQKEGKFTNTADFILGSDIDFLVEVRNLRREQMLGRAIVISNETAALTDDFWAVVIASNRSPEEAARLREIGSAIAREAKLPERWHGHVWVDLPPLPKVEDLGATIVNLSTPERPELELLEKIFPADKWKSMYIEKKWKGHVFAPIAYLEAVKRVAPKVLQEQIAGVKVKSPGI